MTTENPWLPPIITRDDGTPHLNAALARAAATFKAIKRTSEAKVSYRDKSGNWKNYSFRYAGLDEIYSAVRESLSRERLALSHQILDGGKRLLVTLRHASGERLESGVELGNHADWKEFGGALTYSTRYAVSGLLGIAPDDDRDAPLHNRYDVHDANDAPPPRQPRARAQASEWSTPEQQKEIVGLGKARGMQSADIAKIVAEARTSKKTADDVIQRLKMSPDPSEQAGADVSGYAPESDSPF